ncbi:MAG TPA: hypothetical protein VKA07_01660 [Candidatus Sulfotelmatobacter sp.]|nr:hypothetical protein [Candidatus Sulfotelmatobacter sp.]
MKKLKLDRIISITTLVASLVAIFLVLKKPAPVAQPLPAAAIAQHAQSFEQKMAQFDQATQQSAPSGLPAPAKPDAGPASSPPKAEVHINSDEISAVLAQSLGTAGGASLTPDSNIGGAAPTIKDQHVSFDGDLVHGQFLTEVAGKDVWITVSGHISEKDGYAAFDPTEFKVGDLNVPVSLVNPALQKKLGEERDRLKLPDNVGGVKVENGELVMQQK